MFAFVELTDRCNFACDYCYYRNNIIDSKDNTISYEDFLKIACWLKRVDVKGVAITGGEATLVPYLFSCIKVLKNLGFFAHVTSNGSIMDEEYCAELVLAGVDSVSVSLDSLKNTEHEKYRPAYDKVMDALKNLKKSGVPNISIDITVTSQNCHSVDDLFNWAKHEGYSPAVSFISTDCKDNHPEAADFDQVKVINELLSADSCNEQDSFFLENYLAYFSCNQWSLDCRFPKESLFITADCQLRPCPFKKELFIRDFIKMDKEDLDILRGNWLSKIDSECISSKCLNLVIGSHL